MIICFIMEIVFDLALCYTIWNISSKFHFIIACKVKKG